jgi:protein TonB
MPAVVDEDEDMVEANIPTQSELAHTDIGTSTDPGSVDGMGAAPVEDGHGKTGIPTDEPVETETPVNFYEVDQKPEFPGGEKAMYDYLRKNLEYPVLARETKLEGTVVVRFVIDKEGQVVQVEILRSPSNLFNTEALRVIQNMPAWKPASRHGRKVATYFMLPLKFDLL